MTIATLIGCNFCPATVTVQPGQSVRACAGAVGWLVIDLTVNIAGGEPTQAQEVQVHACQVCGRAPGRDRVYKTIPQTRMLEFIKSKISEEATRPAARRKQGASAPTKPSSRRAKGGAK